MAGAEHRREKWEGYVTSVRSSETKITRSVITLEWAHKGIQACSVTGVSGLRQSALLCWLSAFLKQDLDSEVTVTC